MNYKQKYIKYKTKYLYLKKQIGGFNKIYNIINYILDNTFLSFKESKPNTIRLFVIDCITLTEILVEACENIEKNPEVISVPQQKIELDMIKKGIKFIIDSDFLQSLGATQEIINFLRTDPEEKIYKNTKDKTYIYNLYQVQDILEFSLLDTENPINLQIGELIWHHLTFLCEKYFYLLNLYKKYKITSTILYFNDDGIFDLCSSFDNNHKCLKIENLCEWKDEKCQGKKEKDEIILFNYEDGSDYDDVSSEDISNTYFYSKLQKINYNIKVMDKISKNYPFNFIQFFLNTNFENFKINSNRNKDNQTYLFHRIGDYSENLLCNIRDSIEILKKNIRLNSEEITKLDLTRNKDFFIKKGVNENEYKYYINDPEKKIFTENDELYIWKSKSLRFYNTEIYYILNFALKIGDINTRILKIYWIHMIDLCKKYYYLIHLYKKYNIQFTKQLVDINKVCIKIKNKSKCNQNEYCTWNERGELDKQCEIKPIRWK